VQQVGGIGTLFGHDPPKQRRAYDQA
jgi:hypothetical protein